MNNKKWLIINLVLIILIISTIGGIVLFNNYLYSPYEPFNDLREYDNVASIDESNLPSLIVDSSKKIINGYQEQLDNKKINNLEIRNIQNYLNNNEYLMNYLIVDKNTNKIVSKIILWYLKNGNLKKIRVDYYDISDEEYLKYHNCLIESNDINISSSVKDKIINNSKEYIHQNWNIGSAYTYEYIKMTNDDNHHYRFLEERIIFMYF